MAIRLLSRFQIPRLRCIRFASKTVKSPKFVLPEKPVTVSRADQFFREWYPKILQLSSSTPISIDLKGVKDFGPVLQTILSQTAVDRLDNGSISVTPPTEPVPLALYEQSAFREALHDPKTVAERLNGKATEPKEPNDGFTLCMPENGPVVFSALLKTTSEAQIAASFISGLVSAPLNFDAQEDEDDEAIIASLRGELGATSKERPVVLSENMGGAEEVVDNEKQQQLVFLVAEELIGNAVSHSGNAPVSVCAQFDANGRFQLAVSDAGKGVQSPEYPRCGIIHAMQPHVSTESITDKHQGLGLWIALEIARITSGSFLLASNGHYLQSHLKELTVGACPKFPGTFVGIDFSITPDRAGAILDKLLGAETTTIVSSDGDSSPRIVEEKTSAVGEEVVLGEQMNSVSVDLKIYGLEKIEDTMEQPILADLRQLSSNGRMRIDASGVCMSAGLWEKISKSEFVTGILQPPTIV